MANRHLSRMVALQSLYAWDFNGRTQDLAEVVRHTIDEFSREIDDEQFVHQLVNGVRDNQEAIDKQIEAVAPEWPVDQITIIDRNILRLGIFELQFAKEVPPKVAINEAVELGKSFGGESSGKFVNGVLGTLYRTMSAEGGSVPSGEASPAPTKE